MYTGLKHLHSYFAYLALAALVFLKKTLMPGAGENRRYDKLF